MKHKNGFLFKRSLTAIVVLLLFGTMNAAPAQTILPAEDIAEKALAATVYLEMKDKTGKTLGIGSGFFVKPNLIATNYHVIEGAARGTAKLVGKSTTYNIEGVTATDKTNDLALLKVTAYSIKPLPLGDGDTVRIGETVYVAGNPKGLEGTFSDGIISSRRDKYTQERLQMTAPISPGSSGGPVLNRKCEVIGISVAVHRALDAQNLNFAIPSKYLKTLLARGGVAKPFGSGNATISADTYFRRGYTMWELGNYAAAVEYFTKAISLHPNDPFTYYNRGVVKGELEQHIAAIEDYDVAIRLKPDFALAYNNRGLAKYRLGQHIAAITDYDIAIGLKPNDAKAYLNRGLAKAALGQHSAAIADYNIGIRLKPNGADAYNNRGVAKGELGQHFAAIEDYNVAIRLKPDYVLAYNNRGLAKAALGQHFAAIEDYDMAIRLEPDYTDAYNNRGVAKAALGQHFAAIEDYDMAIRLEPDYTDAYNNRGNAKAASGQYFASISDYDVAIRLKPNDATAYLNRGNSKFLLGHRWEAKQDWITALRLATQARDADLKANIEKTLQSLE
ncbi:MAG: tetratricopeptide repeat protein [Candidatus Poribacteria bacterium]|nr:tetratricopeptide repeat protein [Candidatus Poribacteria bacterium]